MLAHVVRAPAANQAEDLVNGKTTLCTAEHLCRDANYTAACSEAECFALDFFFHRINLNELRCLKIRDVKWSLCSDYTTPPDSH